MKRKYAGEWFEKVGMSSAVLKRYDGKYVKYDITGGDKVNFSSWINKNSMKPVEEYSNTVARMYEMLRQPILMAFTKSTNPSSIKKTNKAISVFNKISPKYEHVIGFVHTEVDKWPESRLRMFGVRSDMPFPQIAFHMQDSRVLTYPFDQEITKDSLMGWLDGAFKGEIQASYEKPQAVVGDTIFETLLNYTVPTTPDNYIENIFEEGIDTVMFLYSTESINEQQRNVAF
jgi:hypothetical protein